MRVGDNSGRMLGDAILYRDGRYWSGKQWRKAIRSAKIYDSNDAIALARMLGATVYGWDVETSSWRKSEE